MTLTPLETALIAVVFGGVVGLAVYLLKARTCVSKDECQLKHDKEQERNTHLIEEDEATREDIRLIFEMLREMIQHLPIDGDRKIKILNKRRT